MGLSLCNWRRVRGIIKWTRELFFFHWIYAEISWASILHIRTSRDFNLKWSCWCLAPTAEPSNIPIIFSKAFGCLALRENCRLLSFFFLSFLSISFISSDAAACAFCNEQSKLIEKRVLNRGSWMVLRKLDGSKRERAITRTWRRHGHAVAYNWDEMGQKFWFHFWLVNWSWSKKIKIKIVSA